MRSCGAWGHSLVSAARRAAATTSEDDRDAVPAVHAARLGRGAHDDVDGSAELQATLAAAGAFIEELSASGALVFAGGLHPPSTAVTVDHTGDDVALADGPYTQAPEYLGGLWVVEVPDR